MSTNVGGGKWTEDLGGNDDTSRRIGFIRGPVAL
jgi:hypothetical protein